MNKIIKFRIVKFYLYKNEHGTDRHIHTGQMSSVDDDESDKQRIYRFDPKTQLPEFGVMVFTGRSDSGKTVCIIDIMNYYRDKVDQAVVMCGSKDTCKQYAKRIPNMFVWNGFFPERLKAMYEKAERDVEMGKKRTILIVLDDLAYLKTAINKDPTISRILYNGRHARIILIIAMQYCKDIGPDLRQQVRLTFACAEKNPQNRERLYDAFNPIFQNFPDFDMCMQACTKNYEVFVLNNQHTQSSNICDNVNYYKARIDHTYRINRHGSMWKYHKKMYDEHYFLRTDKERAAMTKDKKKKDGRGRKGTLDDVEIVKGGRRDKQDKKCKAHSSVYPYVQLDKDDKPKSKRRRKTK